MDLIVQVAASHKLSPAGYTLVAVSEETGRVIPYQASQSVGSLGVTRVELVSKKAEKERKLQPAVKPIKPFEVRLHFLADHCSKVCLLLHRCHTGDQLHHRFSITSLISTGVHQSNFNWSNFN